MRCRDRNGNEWESVQAFVRNVCGNWFNKYDRCEGCPIQPRKIGCANYAEKNPGKVAYELGLELYDDEKGWMAVRDPNRIGNFLYWFEEIWRTQCPDWRFGQLVLNVFGDDPIFFYEEEDVLMQKMRAYFKLDGESNEVHGE